MADSGYLAPPEQKPERRQLWEQTWKHLDRFLPQLKAELFPEAINKGRAQNAKSPEPKTMPQPQQFPIRNGEAPPKEAVDVPQQQ